MSILHRFRKAVRPPLRRIGDGDEDAHFRLRLPARGGQAGDWLAFDCVVTTHEDAHGEHLRMSTHLRADFSRLLPGSARVRADADAPLLIEGRREPSGPAGRALARVTARAGGLIDRVLRTAPARRALAPLQSQRVEGWMDIRGTTAPRDGDTTEMLPEGLARIGVVPDREGPPVQSWASPTPHGMAQITTLQLDERHLMTGSQTRRGKRQPLRLAATFAQIVERVPDRDSD